MVLTDAGLETVLLFEEGLDLPHFAAFPLLDSDEGRAVLRRYYEPFLQLARDRGSTFVLSSPTWRANPDQALSRASGSPGVPGSTFMTEPCSPDPRAGLAPGLGHPEPGDVAATGFHAVLLHDLQEVLLELLGLSTCGVWPPVMSTPCLA